MFFICTCLYQYFIALLSFFMANQYFFQRFTFTQAFFPVKLNNFIKLAISTEVALLVYQQILNDNKVQFHTYSLLKNTVFLALSSMNNSTNHNRQNYLYLYNNYLKRKINYDHLLFIILFFLYIILKSTFLLMFNFITLFRFDKLKFSNYNRTGDQNIKVIYYCKKNFYLKCD